MSDSHDDLPPSEPISRLVKPIVRFLHVEAASGGVLLVATIVALILANSPAAAWVEHFWQTPLSVAAGKFAFQLTIEQFINDGLMAVFFFVVGLEVKRELVLGELRDVRRAALPIAAALGGMIVPAGIYLALQSGQPGERGWGIPMATDIAFVVGCLSVMGSRVPHGLRVMMLTLAIADDIGAILVIAIGYSDGIHWNWLLAGLAGLVVVWGFSRLGVRSFMAYIVAGIFVWFAFHESGIHATIAGVILGIMTPARSSVRVDRVKASLNRIDQLFQEDSQHTPHRADKLNRFRHAARELVSPLEFLIHQLHPWVSFVTMPVFALANAGVAVRIQQIGSPIAVAVLAGLVIGKVLGIVLFSWLAVKLRVARLPDGVDLWCLLAGGLLGGIGFTMALFIASLALESHHLPEAKVGILVGSAISAIAGMLVLAMRPRPESPAQQLQESRP